MQEMTDCELAIKKAEQRICAELLCEILEMQRDCFSDRDIIQKVVDELKKNMK